MLELSYYLGFIPTGDYNSNQTLFDLKEGIFINRPPDHNYYLDEIKSAQLYQLLQSHQTTCHAVNLNRQERKTLLKHLLDYFRLHIESFPQINAHLILEEVLEN